MIIVLGSVTVRADAIDEALELSKQHVLRSQLETGCISHEVNIDSDNPNRLVFVERWETMSALDQHFQVPESGEFIIAMADLATTAPQMNLYESSEIQRH